MEAEILDSVKLNWEIRYDVYTDELLLFSPKINGTKLVDRSLEYIENDITIGKVAGKILYIKIEGAQRYFKNSLEKMTKNEIIQDLKANIYA